MRLTRLGGDCFFAIPYKALQGHDENMTLNQTAHLTQRNSPIPFVAAFANLRLRSWRIARLKPDELLWAVLQDAFWQVGEPGDQ